MTRESPKVPQQPQTRFCAGLGSRAFRPRLVWRGHAARRDVARSSAWQALRILPGSWAAQRPAKLRMPDAPPAGFAEWRGWPSIRRLLWHGVPEVIWDRAAVFARPPGEASRRRFPGDAGLDCNRSLTRASGWEQPSTSAVQGGETESDAPGSSTQQGGGLRPPAALFCGRSARFGAVWVPEVARLPATVSVHLPESLPAWASSGWQAVGVGAERRVACPAGEVRAVRPRHAAPARVAAANWTGPQLPPRRV